MSVQKRGAKWTVSVYDPATRGKRWVGTFDSRKAASEAEAKATLQRASTGETITSYAERWLTLHPRPREATNLHYAEQIKPFVQARGRRRLADVTRIEAREWAVEHRAQHGPLRSMFSDAKRDGLIPDNPWTEMRLQQSRGRRDLEVLTVAQVDELATAARAKFGPGIAALILTAAYTGMRPGELYALRWPAIDFDENEIHVTRSYSTRSAQTTAPKNNQHRRIVLFPEARAALLQVPREDETIVFRTINRRPLTGTTLHYYFDPLRTTIGQPAMSFYALRHFAAAHLLNTLGHEAEDVAFQLGHTDGGTLIRKLYGHPSEQLARDRLKAGLGRKVVPITAALELRKDAG